MSKKARRRPSWKKDYVKFPDEYFRLMTALSDAVAMSKRLAEPVDIMIVNSDYVLRVKHFTTDDGKEWLRIIQDD